MMLPRLIAFGFLLGVCMPAFGQEWEKKSAPVMTIWGEKLTPDNVHPEYPRPQFVRSQWQNLNGLWSFAIGAARPAGASDYHQSILVPFSPESALSGVAQKLDMNAQSPACHYWYRRNFVVPADWARKRILLNFGAVNWEAEIFVNSQAVGTHTGGYDPFSYDITGQLAASGEQTLEVRVADQVNGRFGGMIAKPVGKQRTHGTGIFYTASSGIWQTVWLEPVSATHLTDCVLTPDIDKKTIRVQVNATGAAVVEVRVKDAVGKVLSTQSIPANEPEEIPVSGEELSLWSPDSPYLYGLEFTMKEGDAAVDQAQSYFGMRKVNIGIGRDGRSQRIFLNNQEISQVGPLDQGFWPDGIYTAPSEEARMYDLQEIKAFGMNMLRKHIKVEPARFYYDCDKLGLLVWQDMPSLDGDYSGDKQTAQEKANFTSELVRMVKNLRNNPCIVMWIVFNEGWAQVDTPRNVQTVLDLDSSRLVSPASGWVDEKIGQIKDTHAYPGPYYSPAVGRASVCGEFGGIGLAVTGHLWKGSANPYQSAHDAQDLTRRMSGLLDAVQNSWYGGMDAAVYTQLTDVEEEVNGLMTYDRKVVKPNVTEISAKTAAILRLPAIADYSKGVITIRITLTPEQAAKFSQMRIAGSYNGWASSQLMTSKGGGVFEFVVYNPLLKGLSAYRFYPGAGNDWKGAEGPDAFYRHFDASQKEVDLKNVTFGQGD